MGKRLQTVQKSKRENGIIDHHIEVTSNELEALVYGLSILCNYGKVLVTDTVKMEVIKKVHKKLLNDCNIVRQR